MINPNNQRIIIEEPPEEIIEEPIIELIKKINNIPNNIVLTGAFNCGKTTLLKKLFKSGLSNNINYYYDDIIEILIQKKYTKEELIDLLERKILKYFREKILSSREQDEILGLISSRYANITNKHIKIGEISNIIIDYFLSLGKQAQFIIDDFEEVRALLNQKILINYCNLFKKHIISIDENVLDGHEEIFNKHGYQIVKCEYSSNPLFIKSYIDRVFLVLAKTYNLKNLACQLPENYSDIIGDEMVEMITREANGDLILVSKIINELIIKSNEK